MPEQLLTRKRNSHIELVRDEITIVALVERGSNPGHSIVAGEPIQVISFPPSPLDS